MTKKIIALLTLILIMFTLVSCVVVQSFDGVWVSDYPYLEFDFDKGEGYMDVDGKRIEVYVTFPVHYSNITVSDKNIVDIKGENEEAEIFFSTVKKKGDLLHLKIHRFKGEEVEVEIVMKKAES